MNRITSFLKNCFPVLLFGIILIGFFLPFYREGRMIAGGEGSYLFDFHMLLNNYGYSWSNSGTGIIATSLNFGYVFHLVFFQILFSDERIINFVMIYSLYFLPFLAVYLLSLELKLKPWVAFLAALFYVTNPFTANFLKSINQWNMLAVYILPAFLWLILKFYDNPRSLFFFFGIHSLFFAFTNANPPTMILYQISIVVSIIFVSLYKENEVKIKKIIGEYLIVLSSFLLFNMWWIPNWFSILSEVQHSYSKAFALFILDGAKNLNPAFWRVLTLTGLIQYPINPQYDYFYKLYSYPIVYVLLIIPIIILIFFLLKKKVFENYYMFLTPALLVVGFLSKGVNTPFGGIYEFLVKYLPFFSIFKSADEKWGLLFMFLLTLSLILILEDIKTEKFYKVILSLMVIYVGYNLIPFITSNFIPNYKFNQHLLGSRKFLDKIEYQNLREELNKEKELYRVLSLPGSNNYQVALKIEGSQYYTGNDPILSNTNKPFIAPYNGSLIQKFPVFFDSISHPKYLNLLGLFNIKKIVINKDMYPWFEFQEKESIPEIEKILDKNLSSLKNNVIDLYDAGNYYLPRFYIPQKIIYSKETISNLMNSISFDDYKIRSGVYFENTNESTYDEKTIPKITFIQINPTKYRIKIEGAKDPYTLIFSESFHKGWKLYINGLTDSKINGLKNNELTDYGEIVASYFNGDIKEGTHRNTFLEKATFETWGKKPISEEKHLLVNGYANSWYITPEDTGGSENYELIIEYSPQWLFYIGLFISLLTIISCTGYLLIRGVKKLWKRSS